MTEIHLQCSNPRCGKALSFDQQQRGKIQACPFCHQQLIVPERQDLPYVEDTPIERMRLSEIPTDPDSQIYHKAERSYQSRTQKRVKAGAGCMAMFATMVGILVVALGMIISGIWEWGSMGAVISIAGMAGIAAFAYFGYFAEEGDDDLRDRDRSKKRHR